MQLKGKVVLITGANGGLGTALIKAFLDAKVARVYAACRSPAKLQVRDPRVSPLRLDVTDPVGIAQAVRAVGPIDVLLNNAGLNHQQRLLDTALPGAASEEMAVNYFATLNMIRAFAPGLAARGGAVVNVLSILARVAIPAMGSLSASKAAAFRLTEAASAELSGRVQVMAVLPGVIDTAMSRDFPGAKAAPESIAVAILAGLEAGESVLYPDPMAMDIAQGLSADREAVVRELSRFV